MAVRRPLVQVLGQVQELPAGDVTAGVYGAVSTSLAGDLYGRITITDAACLPTSRIFLTVRRADVTAIADEGWLYVAHVVTLGAGTFDVAVGALDTDSVDGFCSNPPTETITIFYSIA